jgi:hypothetical protein
MNPQHHGLQNSARPHAHTLYITLQHGLLSSWSKMQYHKLCNTSITSSVHRMKKVIRAQNIFYLTIRQMPTSIHFLETEIRPVFTNMDSATFSTLYPYQVPFAQIRITRVKPQHEARLRLFPSPPPLLVTEKLDRSILFNSCHPYPIFKVAALLRSN